MKNLVLQWLLLDWHCTLKHLNDPSAHVRSGYNLNRLFMSGVVQNIDQKSIVYSMLQPPWESPWAQISTLLTRQTTHRHTHLDWNIMHFSAVSRMRDSIVISGKQQNKKTLRDITRIEVVWIASLSGVPQCRTPLRSFKSLHVFTDYPHTHTNSRINRYMISDGVSHNSRGSVENGSLMFLNSAFSCKLDWALRKPT